MKTSALIENALKTLILAGTITSIVACSGGGGREGTSSGGGGGYGDESSNFLLNLAGNELVQRLKNASPETYANLPKNFVPDLIQLVDPKNIKVEQEKSIYRDGTELMFNYVEPQNGKPYIETLKLYYKSHASVAVNYMSGDDLHRMKKEIQMRLVHEATHILGIGRSKATDKNARTFAKSLIAAFDKDLILCKFEETILQKKEGDQQFLGFALNRTSGFGITMSVDSIEMLLNYVDVEQSQIDLEKGYGGPQMLRYLDPTQDGYGPAAWVNDATRPISESTGYIPFQFSNAKTINTVTTLSGVVDGANEQLKLEGLNTQKSTKGTITTEVKVDGQVVTEKHEVTCRAYSEPVPFDSKGLELVEKP